MVNEGKGSALIWMMAAGVTLAVVYHLMNKEELQEPPVTTVPREEKAMIPEEGGATVALEPSSPPKRVPLEVPVAGIEKPVIPPVVEKLATIGKATPPDGYRKSWSVEGSWTELLWVAPGKFTMGSPKGEQNRRKWEGLHEVTVTEGFWLGKYEVTQRAWVSMGMENISYFNGPLNPAGRISWNDAVEFCKRLDSFARGKSELPEGYAFRLPTEAEWEYACRAGTTSASYFGDSMDSSQANFDGRFPLGTGKKGINRKRPMPVGYYRANPWGFHDMHGNLAEWCQDSWRDLPGKGEVNPLAKGGQYKVAKGGSWYVHGWECRSTSRCALRPDIQYRTGIGMRVCLGRVLE